LTVSEPTRLTRAGEGCWARRSSARIRPRTKLGIGERLGNDVVAAAVEHPHAVELVRPSSEDDHRGVGVDRGGDPIATADGVEQPERLTVDVRQHELGLLLAEQVQRMSAVLGEQDLVAVGCELLSEEGPRGEMFLDNEDQV